MAGIPAFKASVAETWRQVADRAVDIIAVQHLAKADAENWRKSRAVLRNEIRHSAPDEHVKAFLAEYGNRPANDPC